MKIEKVEAIPFRIPLKKASRWGAHGKRDAQEHVLVRLHTDSGVVGIGEAAPRPTIYGETQRSVFHIIRDVLAPKILGISVMDREGFQSALEAVAWNPSAKGALDMALHDAAAKACGVSLVQFLGGKVKPVRVSYMLSLNFKDRQELLDEAVKIRDTTGITAFKMKAGADAAADIENVRAMREMLGSEGFIFIDSNQLYTPDVAIPTINRMAEYGLAMAEEPVPIGLGIYRRKVADAITVPILADDSVFSLADVRRELQDGAIGVVGIKTGRTGIYDSMRILHLAEAYGLPCWLSSQGASGVGSLTTAHFAAAYRNVTFPADITSPLKQEDDLLQGALDIRDGKWHLSDKHGIGAEIDEDKLKRYRLDW